MSESSQDSGGLADLISRLWRGGQKGTRGRPSGETARAAPEENSGTLVGAPSNRGRSRPARRLTVRLRPTPDSLEGKKRSPGVEQAKAASPFRSCFPISAPAKNTSPDWWTSAGADRSGAGTTFWTKAWLRSSASRAGRPSLWAFAFTPGRSPTPRQRRGSPGGASSPCSSCRTQAETAADHDALPFAPVGRTTPGRGTKGEWRW
jgi:hypothetical protein